MSHLQADKTKLQEAKPSFKRLYSSQSSFLSYVYLWKRTKERRGREEREDGKSGIENRKEAGINKSSSLIIEKEREKFFKMFNRNF